MRQLDTLDAMRLFMRIVERRSFTAAAQDMNLPRSTATGAIKQLEARLGAQLLQRTTRQVNPTHDGEAYYQRCQSILMDIEDAEAGLRNAKPRGTLRVDVHGTLARHYVLPRLPDFLAEYPDLQLHLGEGDRFVDLVREGIDCVLRVGHLQDSSMIGRRVALLNEVTCASPAYLERTGTPKSPDDLDGHQMIVFVSTSTGSPIPLEFARGGDVRERLLPSRLAVVNAETYVAAARMGLGLIQAPRYHVEHDLAEGHLVEVLPGHPPTPTPVTLLYPHSRQLSPRVRVFVDWLAKAFA
jgi:DNA-binding transcriptional LysR family regulator